MNNHRMTRRSFLGTTAAAGGALCASRVFAPWAFAAGQDNWPKLPPARIYKVYAGRTGDMYLAHPTEELAKFEQYLAELEKKFGDIKFIGGDLIPPAQVDQLAEKIRDADAVLLIHLSAHGGDAPVLGKLIDVGLPTVLFSQPFSGHGWMYFPQWHKQGKKVILLPSSDWSEIDRAVGLLRVPAWLKQTRIIAWGTPLGTAASCSAEQIKNRLGAELVSVSNERVQEIMKAIDPKAAEAEAVDHVVEPALEERLAGTDHRGRARREVVQGLGWPASGYRRQNRIGGQPPGGSRHQPEHAFLPDRELPCEERRLRRPA